MIIKSDMLDKINEKESDIRLLLIKLETLHSVLLKDKISVSYADHSFNNLIKGVK